MKSFNTLLAGLMFGTGLILSGMANPAKVQNFLDLFGSWDPESGICHGRRHCCHHAGLLAGAKNDPHRSLEMSSIFLSVQTLILGSLQGQAIFGIGWGTRWLLPGTSGYGLADWCDGHADFCFHHAGWHGCRKINRTKITHSRFSLERKKHVYIHAKPFDQTTGEGLL